MSARMQTPHTKQSSGRVILHTVGPAVRLQEVCSALAELGFAIIPVSDTTSTYPLWTTRCPFHKFAASQAAARLYGLGG
jgi:hypothetical protein